MTAGTRGTSRERQVMKHLLEVGWVVYRAAGSHGCADLVALQRDRAPWLVQVKASAQGAFEHFGPEERRLLIEEAARAGAEAWLCWWPARKPMRWVPADLWPQGRELHSRLYTLIEASSGDVDHALRVARVARH